jgi:hypothetical protein
LPDVPGFGSSWIDGGYLAWIDEPAPKRTASTTKPPAARRKAPAKKAATK